jgi:hypothetical protein
MSSIPGRYVVGVGWILRLEATRALGSGGILRVISFRLNRIHDLWMAVSRYKNCYESLAPEVVD